jgi:hypothetical protein
MFTEIRRPVYRTDFGTPCFHASFVSRGRTNTALSAARKSRVCRSPPVPRLRRNVRSSPKDAVTIGVPGEHAGGDVVVRADVVAGALVPVHHQGVEDRVDRPPGPRQQRFEERGRGSARLVRPLNR